MKYIFQMFVYRGKIKSLEKLECTLGKMFIGIVDASDKMFFQGEF